jgi:hypothetical protein
MRHPVEGKGFRLSGRRIRAKLEGQTLSPGLDLWAALD